MEVSGESPESMAADIQSAFLLQQVKYMHVASITILVFDYLLSLNLEVSLVWGTKWSLTKIFYVLARYPPFIDVPLILWFELTPNIDTKICLPLYVFTSWGVVFGIATAEALLVLRTYALMGCSARALTALVTQYIAFALITIVVVSLFLKSLKFGQPPLAIVAGCHLVDGSIILVVAFILALWNETVLMICTLWVGVKRFRHSNNPLIKTLYRDGISYFVLLFLISAGNLAVLIWGPVELVDLFSTFLRVMHSVLSTRIVLHVRATDRRELQQGGTSLLSTAKFRIPGTVMEYTVE
ncbi:hypothetical protein DFH08DRAFT_1090329 [Mycena albidolilacea]|uniref:DUF6533 domain-containing protein n=1 Tax=Mycena albidolilacea TaxID=1033008 RepID=A0AAD6YXE0_9AGAR|nr:hypothetical protein DFH08DRAFT_1090329 [Mycena albidolilacea]